MPYSREDSTSSEMRHDWLADRWVIVAPQRTQRPNDYVFRPPVALDSSNCPFCIGHEAHTPDAVASYHSKRVSESGKWKVRVVPNKFPAVNASLQAAGMLQTVADAGAESVVELASDQDSLREPLGMVRELGTDTGQHPLSTAILQRHDRQPQEINGHVQDSAIDLFRRRGLTGGHEVIVESPLHLQSISQLDRETTHLVFTAYRDRLRYWLDDCELAYAVVFKNVGLDAGASLAHTHSQLIATDILPTDVARSIKRMQLFMKKESACLFCRMTEDELEQAVRIVEHTPEFISFCPFASRLPSMITILPKQHQSSFQALDNRQLEELSWLTHRLVRRLERCYPETAYNFIIHTAPHALRDAEYFHWRMELFPRITKVAGFEWGSDCYINPLAPENAAQALRAAGV